MDKQQREGQRRDIENKTNNKERGSEDGQREK
jgi:hypothetical protein